MYILLMKTIFDGKIEYQSNDELKNLFNTMDFNLTLNILESAINCGVKLGVYNLDECYVIYNCLLKLKENKNDYK